MKSKLLFILSMMIFGTIGLVVRYIDLSSSERALLSSFLGCLFLLIILVITKKKLSWRLIKANALFLFISGFALGGNWIFLYQSFDHTTIANATLGYYFIDMMLTYEGIVKIQNKLRDLVTPLDGEIDGWGVGLEE
ncbi:ribonuclease E inhibitor RraB [Niallia taxi]|nr:EamA family transporter [Niallia taxi]MDE5051683.1 ribonuclease E inhibitor RraB [Niallia taxi]